MAEKDTQTNFTSETTDDCVDNPRTDLNRAGEPRTDGAPEDNADQRAHEQPADQPPIRKAED